MDSPNFSTVLRNVTTAITQGRNLTKKDRKTALAILALNHQNANVPVIAEIAAIGWDKDPTEAHIDQIVRVIRSFADKGSKEVQAPPPPPPPRKQALAWLRVLGATVVLLLDLYWARYMLTGDAPMRALPPPSSFSKGLCATGGRSAPSLKDRMAASEAFRRTPQHVELGEVPTGAMVAVMAAVLRVFSEGLCATGGRSAPSLKDRMAASEAFRRVRRIHQHVEVGEVPTPSLVAMMAKVRQGWAKMHLSPFSAVDPGLFSGNFIDSSGSGLQLQDWETALLVLGVPAAFGLVLTSRRAWGCVGQVIAPTARSLAARLFSLPYVQGITRSVAAAFAYILNVAPEAAAPPLPVEADVAIEVSTESVLQLLNDIGIENLEAIVAATA
jgi:hypothetical protein